MRKIRQVYDLAERFGIPADIVEQLSFEWGTGAIFVGTREVMEFDLVRPMRRGMRLLRVFPHSLKPTTWAMQMLGRHASRNVIDVTEEQAVSLVRGKSLRLEAAAEDGFVLIRCRGFIVGVGFYRRPMLKSQIPRHRPVENGISG